MVIPWRLEKGDRPSFTVKTTASHTNSRLSFSLALPAKKQCGKRRNIYDNQHLDHPFTCTYVTYDMYSVLLGTRPIGWKRGHRWHIHTGPSSPTITRTLKWSPLSKPNETAATFYDTPDTHNALPKLMICKWCFVLQRNLNIPDPCQS